MSMGTQTRPGRVFISSVFGGFAELRAAAAAAVRLLDLEPVLPERRIALTSSVKEELEQEIARCDAYVGLFGQRRGTVPEHFGEGSGPDALAITEWELQTARRLGLRTLVFTSGDKTRETGLAEFLKRHVENWERGL